MLGAGSCLTASFAGPPIFSVWSLTCCCSEICCFSGTDCFSAGGGDEALSFYGSGLVGLSGVFLSSRVIVGVADAAETAETAETAEVGAGSETRAEFPLC